jgi:hypothetical protein
VYPFLDVRPTAQDTINFNLLFPEQQLSDFFENIFNSYLCAFRRGHGCQTTLLRLLEDWRNALEKNQYVAAETLKSRGSKIDPWGTHFWMSDQLRRIPLILICCFLFDK